jgi:hypothetical protein
MSGQMTMDFNAHVIVVDITADTVISHITDSRASWAGARGTSAIGITMDDNNDIYIACSGIFSMIEGAPWGILRIKSGELTFDQGYYWDTKATTVSGEPAGAAGKTAPWSINHTAGTEAVGTIASLGYLATGEDMMTGHFMKPAMYDFAAKAITLIDIPAGGGYGNGVAKYKGKVLFAFEIAGLANKVYEYDPAAGTSQELFTTDATPYGIIAID